MILDKDIEGLHDGFEGSVNEHCIFTEVFFGHNQGKTSKKCLVTGAINFERDKSKQTDLLVSPNSETPAISSQLNVINVNGLKETTRVGFSPNEHTLSTRDDKVPNGKRVKLSLDEPPVFNSVTCHLVESTCQGITSSCYLVKGDVSMHCLPSFNENDEKEISASKPIPSSVSRASSVNKPWSLRTHGKQTVKSNVNNLSGDKTLSHKDSMKDPRPLLRKYIQDLLTAAGWEITVRTRENKANWGYIYLSPQTRRPIRLFHKVWNLCGQSLSIDRTLLLLEEGKEWADMTSFWSDLSLTLSKIDEKSTLAQQWCLLDPFANLVFIEKKLGLLKAGEVVEARSSLMIDPHANEGAIVSLREGNIIGNLSPNGLCESSLVGGSVLTNTEANNYVSNDSCGTRITVDLGQVNRGRVKALNGSPVSLSEEKCTISGTTDGFNQNNLRANEIDRNSDHSSSCQFEVPPQKGLAVLPEPVSPPQDGSTNSPVRGRYISCCSEEIASEVDRTLKIVSSGQGVPSGSVGPEMLREDINHKTPQAQTANVQKRSVACQFGDDELLISAFIKKNTSRSSAKKSACKTKACKSMPLRKRKTQNGSCRLLPRSLSKGGKHNEGKCFIFGSRTVLSWLISCGKVSLKEVIQYRNSEDNVVVKEGIVTKDGIICTCCNTVVSVSEFKFHAGFGLNHPSLNLVMGSGKSLSLCQLEAWADEYKTRKSATRPIEVEDLDQNDDSCGLCGDGGELICCDNCPSTFHRKCMSDQEFPDGDWYCPRCTCRICGDLVVDKEAAVLTGALKCSQCDHKYHEACLKENVVSQDVASETWFCSKSCQEVYSGLQSYVGALNCLSDGYSWTLLRCIHGDQKVHPAQRFIALKAECNSMLAVALTIMEECFLPMVDARTGIDMIPHVLYNWGSEFARLNYDGFYTMVLEKDDVLISAASIRIHGVTVAEMPLIATCTKYRRQGMCRRLMNSIEEMLISFKVEKLVITAIPNLVETWTVGFGFEPLEDHERKSLSHVNLMVFPGTVWLKKTMYKKPGIDERMSHYHAAPFCKEDQAETTFKIDSVPMVDEGELPKMPRLILDQGECPEATKECKDLYS